MKKIRSLIALILLGVLITGCTQNSSSNNEGDVLRVGMDLQFPPFSYIGDDGEPTGFEPIIAEAFGEYLGREVEIVNTDFGLLIPALETGDVDILIADMSYTEERAQKVDFSDPYRYSQSLALVNADYAAQHNITDEMMAEEFFHLDGMKLVGLTGTFGVVVPQSYGAEVTEVTEIGSGIIEVTSGISTALVASNEVHSFHAANPDTTIVYGVGNVSESSFVVRKGDSEMLNQANEFIASMYEDGGFYDQIREEYDVIISEFLESEELGLDYIIYPPNK